MRDPLTETIDGRTYEVTPLPAGQALKTLARLLRLVAPALGKPGSLRAAGQTLQQVILGGIGGALERLDGEELDALCRELAQTTMVRGGGAPFRLDAQFDVHFQGDVLGVLRWLRFALEANFGPLFSALGQAPPSAPPAAAP
jgi:hypothetical protein